MQAGCNSALTLQVLCAIGPSLHCADLNLNHFPVKQHCDDNQYNTLMDQNNQVIVPFPGATDGVKVRVR